MASNLQNIKLGPCKVIFDVGGTNPVTFETTQGGVTFTYTESTRATNVDQYGDTPVKEIITGRTAEVSLPFAEYDLQKISRVIPESTLTVGATSGTTKLEIKGNTVADLLASAKKLQIQPLDDAATVDDYITLHKAAPKPNISYTYDYNNELVANITFTAYPDTANNNLLVTFGDENAA